MYMYKAKRNVVFGGINYEKGKSYELNDLQLRSIGGYFQAEKEVEAKKPVDEKEVKDEKKKAPEKKGDEKEADKGGAAQRR